MVEGITILKYLELIVLGLGAGTFGTLIGAGGGFVLMPFLLLLYPHESPEIIASISLAVVFFNALSGTEAYALMGRVDFKSGLLFASALIPSTILGTLTTPFVPRILFDAIIATLMIIASVYLLAKHDFHQEMAQCRAAHCLLRHLVERDGTEDTYAYNPILGIGLSFGLGYLSGLAGIGGGIFYVPIFVYVLNFPLRIATATSQFALAILGLTGTLSHIVSGAFTHGVHRTLALAIGVVLGAQLGAHLSRVVKSRLIIRLLAVALGLIGAHLFYTVIEKAVFH
jgi:uncharacterized membrane protein YfcA